MYVAKDMSKKIRFNDVEKIHALDRGQPTSNKR